MANLLEKIKAKLKNDDTSVKALDSDVQIESESNVVKDIVVKDSNVKSFLDENVVITVKFSGGAVRPEIEIKNWQKLNARRLQQIERFVNRKLHELRMAELRRLDSKAGESA